MQHSHGLPSATRPAPQGSPLRRTVGRLAVVVASLLVVGSGQPAASAPAQASGWVLDRFSVSYFEYARPSRNEVRDKAERRFGFGGEYTVPAGNTYRGNGMLTLSVPDRIESGGSYSVDARATGEISVTGSVPAEGELAYIEVRDLCWSGDEEGQARDEKRIMPGETSASLSAVVEPIVFIAPRIIDPTTPPSHNCEFRATLHVGFVVAWEVWIQSQYKPVVPIEPGLTLEANPSRLPPSGQAPSESILTATLRDAAGKAVAGERVELALDPADMGRLDAASGLTDAGGIARVRYTAPMLADLGGRTGLFVRARVPGRGLERALRLEIESFRLALSADPDTLPIQDPPGSAKLRLVAERFDGRPAADDILELELDPADMGSLLGDTLLENRVVTGPQGVAELIFEAPSVATMRGRDLVTLHATNISHGGEASAAIRFVGLKVVGSQPTEGARDVDLRPGGVLTLQLDRAVDPASVSQQTVRVETLWHGLLAAQPRATGATIQIPVTQDPIPDVGLVVTVRLSGGANGIRGADESLLGGDYSLRFTTMPRLNPKVTVSQVVDDPREPSYGVLSVAPKPFLLRVTGGLSGDSELESELATVTLTTPTGGVQTADHTFFPGDWPPRVPDSAVRHGNSANFPVSAVPPAGAFRVTAQVVPFFAAADKAVAADPVTINVNRWQSPRIALGPGVLLVPLQNDRIPGYEWNVSRGSLERWAARLSRDAVGYLPLQSLPVRLGYYMDTSCLDPDTCDFERQPWTAFNDWVRHVGRAGFATPWSYIVAVVPAGWFGNALGEHPDILAHPELYHNMLINGIWSDASLPRGRTRTAPAASPIVEALVSDAAFVHALGDVIGLPDTDGNRDELSGYDAVNDRAIVSNASGWTGAYQSIMNQDVGHGHEWTGQADYVRLLERWTQKSCAGIPPCGPATSLGRRAPASLLQDDVAEPVIGVSGTVLEGAVKTATIEPLVWFDGQPTLDSGGPGDFTVALSDSAGNDLGRYPFTPVFGPADGGRLASFLFAIPRPADLASIRILDGNDEIGGRSRSANPPAVSFSAPVAGGSYGEAFDARWSGQDADGDPLTYQLHFSGDGGQTWLPLLVDSSATSFTLPVTQLPNGPDSRLRVVASDGFDSSRAEIGFGLSGRLRVLATIPDDGETAVSPRASIEAVLRDPLDPDTVNTGSVFLRTLDGKVVPGATTYDPLDGSITFLPNGPLAEAQVYEARLTTRILSAGGSGLLTDYTWRFTTRGRSVFVPVVRQSGNSRPLTATPRPTLGPPPMPTVGPTRTATAPPSATTAATTTPPPPTTAPSATPPSATARPTTQPSPTAPLVESPAAAAALTTGADANLRRQAFSAGEAIQLWVRATNPAATAVTADFEFVVVGDNGYAPAELAWRGRLEIPAGGSWFRLERTVPADMPPGPYRFLGSVAVGSNASTATADLFVADTLQRVDDFGDPASGWTQVDDANVRSGYLDGVFQILVKTADYWRLDTPNASATSFALEADVTFVGEAAGAAGLVAGLSADSQSFLIFRIVRDGRFGLYRRSAGAWQTLLPLATSTSIDNAANHVMLTRQGTEVRLYANGQLLAVTTESSSVSGRVGLYAEATTPGLDARFDSFRLYRLR